MNLHHSAKVWVEVGHQCQGCEKIPAELAVCWPGPMLGQKIERKVVDQAWSPDAEGLDVVRARILQNHAVFESAQMQPQGQECRILELVEAPFIGVGDLGYKRRLKHCMAPRKAKMAAAVLERQKKAVPHA